LASESAVTVNEERKELPASLCAFAVLLGASPAHGYGIDGLEMAGI